MAPGLLHAGLRALVAAVGRAPRGVPVEPEQLRRHRRLRTQAVYRVVACEEAHVLVEVVAAPGLDPGHRLRLTRSSVEAMEPVADSELGPADGP